MSTDLSKTYDPTTVEETAYKVWIDERCFATDPQAAGEPYSIVIPPPNVTGALHLGHAINNTLQDILTRVHRMRGFNTVWIPGIDHAGIATQAVVEKELKEKENKTRHDVGREGLVERIWKWKEQYGDRIVSQLKRLGASCDWDRTRFTLDEQCARAVRETFFKLFKDGLIYRGKKLVNWDVHLQTSISNDELYHEKVKTNLWHIKYPIDGTDKQMIVATTRPETMLGDTAVAVHPDDPRWNWAIGKSVKLPLTNRLIPIIADPILVNMEFGSGCVKVTPAHDPNDYAVWERQKGAIEIINILNPDGTLNENAGAYKGMTRDASRKKVVEDLTHQCLLDREEPYETEVGHSDRSKTAIEPYLSDQWFVKMAPLAEPALEVVRNGTVKFFPERHAQQYLSWLGEKRDWPISRQLWWGHRITVWSLREKITNPTTKQLETVATWLRETFSWVTSGRMAIQFRGQIVPAHEYERNDDALRNGFVCIRDPDGADKEIVRYFEERGFVQDSDVLDTWFSSALWPHSTLGWPEQTEALAKWYPTSVLLTARDIITLWVARMVMMGMYNMGRAEGRGQRAETNAAADSALIPHPPSLLGIPFHHVAINPTILDGKGERMSKSKGNGVDPVDIIETHGADALRFTLTQMATETQDVRMPVKKLPSGKNTSEKFDVGRNFCNKLWNAARFAFSNIESAPAEPADEIKWSLVDRWIVSRFNRTVAEANEALASYRFDQYARTCYDFFWRDFCDWYVEASKPAMKDPKRAGQTASILASLLDGSLRLMHPMIPFITETIWWRLNEVRPQRGLPGRIECPTSERLIKAPWPTVGDFSEASEHIFPKLQAIIVAIRNVRNDYKVDPKRPVTVSIAPPGAEAVRATNDNRELIELLATCTIKDVQAGLKQPANSAAVTVNNGCDVFVEGLVDSDTEKQRNEKRCDELRKQIAAMKGRLSNEGYIAKAPPNLVQQTKDQLAAAEAELAKLGC